MKTEVEIPTKDTEIQVKDMPIGSFGLRRSYSEEEHVVLRTCVGLVSLTDPNREWIWHGRKGAPDLRITPLPAGTKVTMISDEEA